MPNLQPSKSIKGKIINQNTVKGNILPSKSIKGKITNDVTDASETKKGVIRIATNEEALEGIDNTTAITPYTLKLKTSTYIHDQGVASNVWEIEHNLDKKPSITVVDSGDTVISIYKKEYVGTNKVILTFNGAFKGKAYLN